MPMLRRRQQSSVLRPFATGPANASRCIDMPEAECSMRAETTSARVRGVALPRF